MLFLTVGKMKTITLFGCYITKLCARNLVVSSGDVEILFLHLTQDRIKDIYS